MRPAIVVGDSRTGETQKFDGPYYMLRAISQMHALARPVMQFGRLEANFNVVPVDYVVNAIAAAAAEPDALDQTLHLVDPDPVTSGELVNLLSEHYAGRPPQGRIPPSLVETSLRVPMVRARFGGTPRESIAYLNHPVRFDTRRALNVLAKHGLAPPRFEDYVEPMVEFFRDHEHDEALMPKARGVSAPPEIPLQETLLHGHRVCYRCARERPRDRARARHHLELRHLGARDALPRRALHRASRRTCSATASRPSRAGDYSLGAYASGVRDILVALGHDSATFVGHSLGGGIAMQLAYQFPERCERLVLVSSGGLGRELSVVLRAAALPGSECVIPILAAARADGRGPGRRAAGSSASGSRRAPTSRRWRAATPRCLTARPARPSCTRCARWSTRAGSG